MGDGAKYIFRMDDICPTMKWDRFDRMMAIFKQYQVVPLLGIIPENADPSLKVDPENPDFWEIMRHLIREGRVEIAQHGTHHEYLFSNRGLLAENFGFPARSEFAGAAYEWQLERIAKGKKVLETHGIHTNYFMAPSHSYDATTLKALHALGFVAVTDGVSRYPYLEHNLVFVPQIHWGPPATRSGVSTVCIHSNEISEKQINRIVAFLEKHHTEVIRFSDSLEDVKPYSRWFAMYWKAKYKILDQTILPGLVKIRNTILQK